MNIHILMVVLGLVLVIAFAHAVVRLCMYILQPPDYPVTPLPTIEPATAIPVSFQHDSHDDTDDDDPKEVIAPPPPAYGFWNGSTVCDFNRTREVS